MRWASRSNTCSSSCSPVATIDVRARSMSCSWVQSSTATPTIGQSRSFRSSSRYSDRKVITFARSPVIPKITNTSHAIGPSRFGCGATVCRVAGAPGDAPGRCAGGSVRLRGLPLGGGRLVTAQPAGPAHLLELRLVDVPPPTEERVAHRLLVAHDLGVVEVVELLHDLERPPPFEHVATD